MLTSLRVTGFRNFSSLALEGLTRVNLLVGENNAGKTSVLEAMEILLLARSLPQVIWRSLTRRGESVQPLQPDTEIYPVPDLDLRHLFHGREISPRTSFELRGESSQGPLGVTCTAVIESQDSARLRQLDLPMAEQEDGRLALEIELDAGPDTQPARLPLERSLDEPKPPALQFIGPADPRVESLRMLWDAIVLTPEEGKVIEALRLIQPDIERIASLSLGRGNAGGIFVKLDKSDRRVPLGSMGEGIKRLFVVAMSLVASAGGYLLVDEIDTSFHYSVMVKMWKLVVETARRLDVQVFATTHSLDCLYALAELYEQEPGIRRDISLHRIERGSGASMRYSADEILAAARRQMEVR
jgi:hypothetical protein